MSSDKKKSQQVWGRRSAEFYATLQEKAVTVQVATGQRFTGILVGVDTYELILRQAGGMELLVYKGNVVYVHPAAGRRQGNGG